MSKEIQTTESQAKTLMLAIPKSILDYHQELAAKQEEAYWASGELSLLWQKQYYPEYSKAAIRKAVGEIYGIAAGTVRDRERVAQAVPRKIRKQLPFLKFSHWRNIIPAGQNRAEEMVWESIAMFEAEGKGPSVDQILSWRDIDSEITAPVWVLRLDSGMEYMEKIRDDPLAHPKVRMIMERTIKEVDELGRQLKLDRFRLKGGEDGTTDSGNAG